MNKLSYLRKKNNLTQEYVATVLGISRYKYSWIETGKSPLTMDEAKELAKLYNVELKFILEDAILDTGKNAIRTGLIQAINKAPEEWLPEIRSFLEYLKFRDNK